MAKPKTGSIKGGKKGSRKFGRNKIKCERYRRNDRRNKNKARKAAKRIRTRECWLANKS